MHLEELVQQHGDLWLSHAAQQESFNKRALDDVVPLKHLSILRSACHISPGERIEVEHNRVH